MLSYHVGNHFLSSSEVPISANSWKIACVRVCDKYDGCCSPATLIKMDSSTNVSPVFSNTLLQSRITMHDHLSQTDQPATFDKVQSKLITLWRQMQFRFQSI